MTDNKQARDEAYERALEFVQRRGLVYSRPHPTDREATEQEEAEKSLARTFLTFTAQEKRIEAALQPLDDETGLKRDEAKGAAAMDS